MQTPKLKSSKNQVELHLSGMPVPKKNSRRLVRGKNGKPLFLPSKSFGTWHDQAWLELSPPRYQFAGPCVVILTYRMPDRRRRDLTNMTESVMDLLVDKGYLADDCWTVVPNLHIKVSDIDKENPGVTVNIYGV